MEPLDDADINEYQDLLASLSDDDEEHMGSDPVNDSRNPELNGEPAHDIHCENQIESIQLL